MYTRGTRSRHPPSKYLVTMLTCAVITGYTPQAAPFSYPRFRVKPCCLHSGTDAGRHVAA